LALLQDFGDLAVVIDSSYFALRDEEHLIALVATVDDSVSRQEDLAVY
jgi:hypothetical protein